MNLLRQCRQTTANVESIAGLRKPCPPSLQVFRTQIVKKVPVQKLADKECLHMPVHKEKIGPIVLFMAPADVASVAVDIAIPCRVDVHGAVRVRPTVEVVLALTIMSRHVQHCSGIEAARVVPRIGLLDTIRDHDYFTGPSAV